MLLTELILSKRGPLAKVWLSAHHERKLSKQQALGVDVGESVEAILGQEDGGVTLRLSGQLMLGVTRIYSRKAQYLLDDCKETRENISRAFRPGNVDLPEDQHRASKNAITFNDTENNFDIFDWSWGAPPPLPLSTSGTSSTQLNLRPSGRGEYGAYNFGRPHAPSLYGGSTPSREQSADGDTAHLESNEFSEIDLGIQFDSPGVARRVETPKSRQSSLRLSRYSKDRSMEPQQEIPFHDDNLDLGLYTDDLPALPPLDDRSRRETSALSTPPPASPPPITDITPRTATRVANLANLADARERSSPAAPKAKRNKLVEADDELELDDTELAFNRDNSDILTVERYIPADSELMDLREIVADPGAYFLPTIKVGGESMFYAGPQGLAPELAELFTFPSNILRRRGAQAEDDERASKRPRTEEQDVELEEQGQERESEVLEVEAARRQSVVPSEQFGFDGMGGVDDTFNLGQGDDMPNLEFDDQPIFQTPSKSKNARAASIAPSLAPSQVDVAIQQGQRAQGDFTLAIFDSRAQGGDSQSQSQSQSLVTPTKSIVSDQPSRTSSGFSKETGMAMGLLRKELDAIEEETKVLQFEKMAEKATKKAAASFFFELLVLGTKDFVKLEQEKPYQDIRIEGKEKLWDDIVA